MRNCGSHEGLENLSPKVQDFVQGVDSALKEIFGKLDGYVGGAFTCNSGRIRHTVHMHTVLYLAYLYVTETFAEHDICRELLFNLTRLQTR